MLYSEGMARDHQSACLGIYRSSSYLNGRPVYKQDDGENYLYYHKSENSWLVGPHVGNNYAWVRNQLDQSMSSSSTSSSDDSDSDSDDSVASNSDHSIGSSGKFTAPGPWLLRISLLQIFQYFFEILHHSGFMY